MKRTAIFLILCIMLHTTSVCADVKGDLDKIEEIFGVDNSECTIIERINYLEDELGIESHGNTISERINEILIMLGIDDTSSVYSDEGKDSSVLKTSTDNEKDNIDSTTALIENNDAESQEDTYTSDTVPEDSRTLSFLNSLSEQERSIRGFYKCETREHKDAVSYVIEIEPIGDNEIVIIDGFYETLLGNIEHGSLYTCFHAVSLDDIIFVDGESVLWKDTIYTRTTEFDSYSNIISDGITRDYYLEHFEGSSIENAKYHIKYDLTNGFKYVFQNEEFLYPNAVALGHVVIEDPEDPDSLWWGVIEDQAMFGTKDGFILSEELLVDISHCFAAGYYKFVDDGIQFITGDYIIEEEELAILQEPTEWKLAYQDFVRNNSYLGENGFYLLKWEVGDEDDTVENFKCDISLLYIDEDDIPEMVIGLYFSDNLVVSWKPTGLAVSIIPRMNITGYFEKGNIFFTHRYGVQFAFYQINNTGMTERTYSGGVRFSGLKFVGYYLNDSVVSKSECKDALRDYCRGGKLRTFRSESFYGYDTFLSF